MEKKKTILRKEEKFRESMPNIGLQAIHEHIPVGIYLYEDSLTYINQGYAEIIGEKYENIKNWTLNDFLNIIPSEYHPGMADLRGKSLRGERKHGRIIFPIRKKNGDLIYVQSDTRHFFIDGKALTLGTLVDIDHLKKEEQKLRDSKIELDEKIQTTNYELRQERKLFNRFFDLNPNSIAFYNTNGILIRSNHRYRKIFPNNALSEYNIFGDGNFKFGLLKEKFNLLRAGKEISLKDLHYRISSTPYSPEKTLIINIHAFPIYNSENKIDNFAVMYEDDTTSHIIKTQLLELEQKFKTFYDNAVVGFALVDSHGFITEVNQAMVNIVGTSDKSGLVGHSITEFAENYDFSKITFEKISTPEECDSEGGDFNYYDTCVETEILNANRETIHVEIRINETSIDGNTYYRAIVRNISEKVLAEQALQQSKQVEYISAISVISSMFIHNPNLRSSISRGLKVLGNTLNADMIAIYQKESKDTTDLENDYTLKWNWQKNGFHLDEGRMKSNIVITQLNEYENMPMNVYVHDAIQNMKMPETTKKFFLTNGIDFVLLARIVTDDFTMFGTMVITSDITRGKFNRREIALAIQIATIFGFALSNGKPTYYQHE